ncbi:MAG: DUF4388 domain-containing protein [Thermoanaerobaculia bacterium]
MPDQAPSTKFLYRGDLAQTPLPEILFTIHRYKAPGIITCTRDEETKQIFVDAGRIIFATSSLIADSLGDRLLNLGLITREQYDESARRLGEGKRQGAILVEMGAIQPKDLFINVRDQVQDIVWSIFSWERGTVTFEAGRERVSEFIKLNLSIPQAVLQGVRRVPDPRALLMRLGGKTTLLHRTPDADFSELTLTPEEEALLAQIDGKKPLVDLTNAGTLPPPVNAKLLYAFFALHLVAVRTPNIIKVQLGVSPKG